MINKTWTSLLVTMFLHLSLTIQAENLTIATWNIANLHHETNIPLRDGAEPRDDDDYSRLAAIGANLNADVIVLQEIGSLAALERVFPSSEYEQHISSRYVSGIETQPANKRDIFTAAVVKKGRFTSPLKVSTFTALSIQHIEYGSRGYQDRPTRAGIVVELEFLGKPTKILGLHLKSSCHEWSLFPVEDVNFSNPDREFSSRYDCRTLAAQQSILENWVESEIARGFQVIIAGDFNRRLNKLIRNPSRNEHFWAALNDGEPKGISLLKGPLGKDVQCWTKHDKRFEEHIDFIVYDSQIENSSDSISIQKIGLGFDTDAKYAGDLKEKLSDHCPVVMTIK